MQFVIYYIIIPGEKTLNHPELKINTYCVSNLLFKCIMCKFLGGYMSSNIMFWQKKLRKMKKYAK